MAKLYTRRGDQGQTDLFQGSRVSKTDVRVKAYGQVDELCSLIGWACRLCRHEPLGKVLQNIQQNLFVLGSDLATPMETGTSSSALRIGASDVAELEGHIDAMCHSLPPMKNFILPGGCELACRLHLARTCCRRAERASVAAGEVHHVNTEAIRYLNRLSDLLFAMARLANQQASEPEVIWRCPDNKAP